MAGVKGRSGGPRKNAGGARSGAGRPAKAAAEKSANAKAPRKTRGTACDKPATTPLPDMDMLKLLQDIALGRVPASATQVRAAVAAVQYTHHKLGEGGKKDAKQKQAEGITGGRFAPRPPPASARRPN
jgi:hypothetical protein